MFSTKRKKRRASPRILFEKKRYPLPYGIMKQEKGSGGLPFHYFLGYFRSLCNNRAGKNIYLTENPLSKCVYYE